MGRSRDVGEFGVAAIGTFTRRRRPTAQKKSRKRERLRPNQGEEPGR